MADQGCPNEGPDRRIFGKLTCFLQRLFTWPTGYEPLSLSVMFPWPNALVSLAILALGLPVWLHLLTVYIALNVPIPFSKIGKWGVKHSLHVRWGWRYDFNAQIFIWPEAAIKKTSRAIFY